MTMYESGNDYGISHHQKRTISSLVTLLTTTLLSSRGLTRCVGPAGPSNESML